MIQGWAGCLQWQRERWEQSSCRVLMRVDLMHEGIRQVTALFKNFCLYSLSRPSRFVQSGVWRDLFEEERKIKVVAHVVVLWQFPSNTRLSTTQCAAALMCDRIEQPLGQGKIGSEAVIKSDLPIADCIANFSIARSLRLPTYPKNEVKCQPQYPL